MSRKIVSQNGIRKYGMVFPENMNPLEIELYCYALTRGDYGKTMRVKKNMELSDYKLLSPYEHFIIAVQYMWPTDVVIKNRGYTNTQLLRTLEELCNNDDVCLAGAASVRLKIVSGVSSLNSGSVRPIRLGTSLIIAT